MSVHPEAATGVLLTITVLQSYGPSDGAKPLQESGKLDPMRLRLIVMLLVIWAFAVFGQDKPTATTSSTTDPELTLPIQVSRIVSARQKVEAYVQDLKARKDLKPEVIATATDKYRDAFGAYSGWVVAVKLAIESGQSKKLGSDQAYKTLAQDAANATTKFVAYATDQLKTPQTAEGKRGVVVILDVINKLVPIGIDIWKKASTVKTDRLKDEAEYVGGQILWRDWAAIPERK